ncbi:MAG: prephenate dehydrogenase [Sulfurospirillum sp.]|nr:MAG: prephenate dehydrogenase [Sulfurospirillum sp.]
MKVAIVGLGLMGGSFALALKKSSLKAEILGYDNSVKNSTEALKLGFVDKIVDFEDIKRADLIILAVPVDAIITYLQKLKDIKDSQTIIDLGSAKSLIIKNTPQSIRKNLIAAHPMAGTEKSGPNAAIEDLYEDKVVVLCDFNDSGEIQQEVALKVFEALKMKIVYMDSDEHDKHAAYISHLPHAISFALANSVLSQEDPKSILALAGGGFKDVSRIAKSSPIMWSDIFKQNRENLLKSLDDFEYELKSVKRLIEDEKWEELQEWISRANRLHEIL